MIRVRSVCPQFPVNTVPTRSNPQWFIQSAANHTGTTWTVRLIPCKPIFVFTVWLSFDPFVRLLLVTIFLPISLLELALQLLYFFSQLIILTHQKWDFLEQSLRLFKARARLLVLHSVRILFYWLQLTTLCRDSMRIYTRIVDYLWRLF